LQSAPELNRIASSSFTPLRSRTSNEASHLHFDSIQLRVPVLRLSIID